MALLLQKQSQPTGLLLPPLGHMLTPATRNTVQETSHGSEINSLGAFTLACGLSCWGPTGLQRLERHETSPSKQGRQRLRLETPYVQESENVGLKLNIQKTKIMASGPITSRQIDVETVTALYFGAPKSLQMVTSAMKLKDACSSEEKL